MTEAEWRQAVQWQGNRFEVVSAEQTPAEANLQLS